MMRPPIRALDALRRAGLTLDAALQLEDAALTRLPGLGPREVTALRRYATRPGRIVVTRHPALVEYLLEVGLITSEDPVIPHATEEDVRHRHVIGVLPLSLAVHAASVTEVPLSLTPEDRGREISLARLREIAGRPVTYVVRRKEEPKTQPNMEDKDA